MQESGPGEKLSQAAQENLARMLERMPGLRYDLIPPETLLVDGSWDENEYRMYGEGDARLLVELGGLQPHHRVLDLGCGVGQKARPLTQYLTTGTYEGLDIMPGQIAWCQENITPRFPNFRFQWADVFSSFYNPEGALKASEYRFPFRDAEFDFAFLVSVFTHLLPEDLEHYVEELARVVKPGGRTFITYFLFNEKALACMEQGWGRYNFAYTLDSEVCRVLDPELPEVATAHDETYIRGVYKRFGFEIVEPIRPGDWSGRDDYYSVIFPGLRELNPYLQDILVAVRK